MFAWTAVLKLQSQGTGIKQTMQLAAYNKKAREKQEKKKKKDKRCNGSYNKIPKETERRRRRRKNDTTVATTNFHRAKGERKLMQQYKSGNNKN
jgi:hypothetical protein